MIQNAFAQHLNNRVRRLIGEELAVVREKVRRGKPLKVTPGKAVFFEPFITFKANSGLDAKAPCKSLRRKQIEAGFPAYCGD